MNQLAISFDLHKPEFTSLARRRDPETSIAAARKVEREGTVARHERLICECLAAFGPQTAKEMELSLLMSAKDARDMLTSVEISRRSGGLMKEVKTDHYEYGTGHFVLTKKARCQYTGTRNGFKVWGLIP